jgi:hypothetical protein
MREAEATTAERKKPDLRWELVDHQAGRGVAFRPFAVECKRVRSSTKSWNFNREYAISGVARFVSDSHRYGENSDRGAMVAYWQGMKYEDVVAEINQHLSDAGLPGVDVGQGVPRESTQVLERAFALSPYRLTHLWVDVRGVGDQHEDSTAEAADPGGSTPSTVGALAGLGSPAPGAESAIVALDETGRGVAARLDFGAIDSRGCDQSPSG